MNFPVSINSDSAYVKLGDTITFTSSISSTLSDGTSITNGKAAIGCTIAYTEETPILTSSFRSIMIEEYIHLHPILGNYDLNTGRGLANFYALPYGDSIKVEIKVVPLKVGTYSIRINSSFFEGTQGKTRTQPFYEMFNHHFDELWKIPGDDYRPGDYGYDSRYLFAVYE